MFIWRRIRLVRKHALLLAALPLLSLLTLFTPFFSQNAFAVAPDDVLNRARAWSILNAIIDNRSDMKSSLSTGQADGCDIMDDARNVFVGNHATGANGRGDADWESLRNNTGLANSALNSVGISGGCRGLLLKIGYTFDGNNWVQPGDFGNKLSERIRDALIPDAFFGANIGDGQPGDALSYAILYYYLKNVCGWDYRNAYIPNDNPQTTEGVRNLEAQQNGAKGESVGKHYHTYTYEAGQTHDNTYFKSGGTDNDVFVGSKTGFASSGNNDAEIDCGDNNADTIGAKLADNHRFADAYAALLKPGGDTTLGTCADRYTTPDQQAACDAGFNNKNNPSFCTDTYPVVPIQDTNATLREACLYGQKATGDSSSTTPTPGSEDSNGSDKTTCAVPGVGWIICPVVTFLSKVTDAAYSFVSGLLNVTPLTTDTNASSGLYFSWSIMRNFANVVFVIAFLAIIFSQLTNVGISNLGIKKMLPRLVALAIAVNVSYWGWAIAVDASNIAGSSLYHLLTGLQETAGIPLPNTGVFSGGGWAAVAGAVLTGGAVLGATLFLGLAVLLPLLVVVLATILTVFIALVLRQALIVILIVISPLALAAYLLPNTQPLAKTYLSISKTLLLIYPIVGIVFGGSALASTIIMASSSEPYVKLAGAAAAVIPLIAVPALMKVINGIGSRFGLPNIGFKLEGMKKGAEGYRDYRKNVTQKRRFERAAGERGLGKLANRFGPEGSRRQRTARWLAGTGVTASQNKELRRQSVERAAKEEAQSYVVGRVAVGAGASVGAKQAAEAFAEKLAGPTGDVSKIKANAKAAQTKEFIDAVNNEKATMSRTDASTLMAIMKDTSSSETRRAAAAGQLMKVGADKDIHKALTYLGGYDEDASGNLTRRTTPDSALSSLQQQVASDIGSRKPLSLGGTDMAALNTGNYDGDFNSKIAQRLTGGKISAEALAKASPDELKAINDYVAANATALKAAKPLVMAKLKSDIDAYRKNTTIAQPTPEIGGHMDTIGGLL